MKKLLFVSIDDDDHELVARYAGAMRLPSMTLARRAAM
jgi:hypothetical protein